MVQTRVQPGVTRVVIGVRFGNVSKCVNLAQVADSACQLFWFFWLFHWCRFTRKWRTFWLNGKLTELRTSMRTTWPSKSLCSNSSTSIRQSSTSPSSRAGWLTTLIGFSPLEIVSVWLFADRFSGYPGNYTAAFGSDGRLEQCTNNDCLMEMAQNLAIIFVGKQIVNNTLEVGKPSV